MTADEVAAQLFSGLHASFGEHPGRRAAHAKGVLCSGTFTAGAEAAGLSTAPHFRGGTHPVHVRFSNGSGNPNNPDAARDGRGMAVKIRLPDGATTDIVTLSLPVFFVRTPEELVEFNVARRPDPATGAPDVEKVGAFLAAHPETVPAVTAAMTAPVPASYAQVTYHAIHTFGFVAGRGDSAGPTRFGRYHFVPAAGEAGLTDDEAAARGPDVLRVELDARFAAGPARFSVELELAAADDPVEDPTALWPDGRERVTLGELSLTALAFDREHDGDILVFDPTRITDGITLTDDKILLARPAVYSLSVAERTA